MKVHFIAIGGSAMHNLAIALHKKGMEVTGSDDYFFEPSKSRLEKYGLLPKEVGWFAERITENIDSVILGMAAQIDNPELVKAKELGLNIYSYPEYLYEQSKDKTRVVIGGSHGKTSITAMILHVLQKVNIQFDYMVGAQLEGFETMVQITDAPIMILEGDEYLSSAIDRRPKFHLYQPNIALLSGIAWDHINVFPTYENYVEQFSIFTDMITESIIYCEADNEVKKVVENSENKIQKLPYSTPKHVIENGVTILETDRGRVPLQVFGDHNLQNLTGARLVCNQLAVSDQQFYDAIQDFTGASKRLELVKKSDTAAIYKDFAHSPSKLKATTEAVKKQYTERALIACMELHTYSSLNKEFLEQYKHSMDLADKAIVYYNPEIVENKRLEEISPELIKQEFGREDLHVFTSSAEMVELLKKEDWENKNLLLMSSGNFHGVDFAELADQLIIGGKG
ncbi:MAG: peptidoglycan synthetase [Flavobacteriales bacterium]|nr:peptidoglycan synthetase [Flavobacteriales bacterium]